jgi:hypothetical protein
LAALLRLLKEHLGRFALRSGHVRREDQTGSGKINPRLGCLLAPPGVGSPEREREN